MSHIESVGFKFVRRPGLRGPLSPAPAGALSLTLFLLTAYRCSFFSSLSGIAMRACMHAHACECLSAFTTYTGVLDGVVGVRRLRRPHSLSLSLFSLSSLSLLSRSPIYIYRERKAYSMTSWVSVVFAGLNDGRVVVCRSLGALVPPGPMGHA